MSVMPRGRGRGRGRGGRSRATTSRNTLQRLFKGKKLNPPQDPPSLTERPWNNAVLIFPATGPITIEPKALATVFTDQMGFTALKRTQTKFELRCYSMRTWLLDEKKPLTVGYFSVSQGPASLSELSDFGAINRYARVGYEWPQDEKNITFQFVSDGSAGKEVIAKIQVAASVPTLSYLHCLWRSAEGAPWTVAEKITEITQHLDSFSFE